MRLPSGELHTVTACPFADAPPLAALVPTGGHPARAG